ncbi:MAG: DUF2520 domain-containing protein [Polyangiaceae bacterium]|nr:DUF2520 domain-containing protein [Polyangiaceae bacterium]
MRSVVVVGKGKVGSALARAGRSAGLRITTTAARKLPRSLPASDLVIVACADGAIESVARALAPKLRIATCVAHCSGSIDAEALGVLRADGHAVGAMHPLASFAHASAPPSLEGAALVVTGDTKARRACVRFGKKIGMRPIEPGKLHGPRYHAAAALLANGAAALADAATGLLVAAGIPPRLHGALLGPLLGSVAENVRKLGPAAALTGPIRRGDRVAVEKHLAAADAAGVGDLYRAAALAQIPIARRLGEAPKDALDALEGVLKQGEARRSQERAIPRVRRL